MSSQKANPQCSGQRKLFCWTGGIGRENFRTAGRAAASRGKRSCRRTAMGEALETLRGPGLKMTTSPAQRSTNPENQIDATCASSISSARARDLHNRFPYELPGANACVQRTRHFTRIPISHFATGTRAQCINWQPTTTGRANHHWRWTTASPPKRYRATNQGHGTAQDACPPFYGYPEEFICSMGSVKRGPHSPLLRIAGAQNAMIKGYSKCNDPGQMSMQTSPDS
jgi:hypothetical protein